MVPCLSWTVKLPAVLRKNPSGSTNYLVFQHFLCIWILSNNVTENSNTHWCSRRNHALRAGACFINVLLVCKERYEYTVNTVKCPSFHRGVFLLIMLQLFKGNLLKCILTLLCKLNKDAINPWANKQNKGVKSTLIMLLNCFLTSVIKNHQKYELNLTDLLLL